MSSAASPAGIAASGASQIVTVANARALPCEAGRELCAALEAGHILFFPKTPFEISAAERQILLGQKQTSAAYHKNVAYRPAEDRVTGLDKSESAEAEQLRAILKRYSQSASALLDSVLVPYAGKWKLDYASYRPVEEKGRAARLHARNDLCHVDAFPTRPTNGDRILRLFTNVNPSQSRVWLTAQTFEAVGPRFAKAIGVPRAPGKDPVRRAARALGRLLRVPAARRSPYDEFMHRCHNAMKEDAEFQENSPKQRWEFPPDSTWIVFTDCTSHAVLEGQYALEQTFIVSRGAMVAPERSPVAILERLAGHSLTL
ncbi:MAG TPA: Kdo hydroxylase family protein [Candidatus Acidoferrales bacterium]|nr:Kdo hydroxylase family protein [Candidatus Acidoferrales bacterium]